LGDEISLTNIDEFDCYIERDWDEIVVEKKEYKPDERVRERSSQSSEEKRTDHCSSQRGSTLMESFPVG
jgi:hypothetical protein